MADPRKQLSNLPKEVMWRVLGFVDEMHRAHWRQVARRWSHLDKTRNRLNWSNLNSSAGYYSFSCLASTMGGGRRASTVRPMPNELLVGLVVQFLDEPDDGDRLRHIARVWAEYLAQNRLRVAAAAGASAAAAAAAASPSGDDGINSGAVPFLPLGVTFGPETEPGPLDTTGRLPNELLESMFDFLDEDQTMNCASVARRWRSSAMELILTSFLSPILWVIPQGTVRKICSNLHPTDISQVACVCQDWKQLARDVPTLAPGLVD